MANVAGIAARIRRGLAKLSDEQLRRLCADVEKSLAKIASRVSDVANMPYSKPAEAAKAEEAMKKLLARLAKAKAFDAEVLMIGRSILPVLVGLTRGIQPYNRLGYLGRRIKRLNRALAAIATGTEPAQFLQALRRFEQDAHHVLPKLLLKDKRAAELLKKLNKHFSGLDFTDAKRMPAVVLTADVHRLAQGNLGPREFGQTLEQLAKSGQKVPTLGDYRTLGQYSDEAKDVLSFSTELDTMIKATLAKKGPLSLEAVVKEIDDYYRNALPWYVDPQAEQGRHFREFMARVLAAAKRVDHGG